MSSELMIRLSNVHKTFWMGKKPVYALCGVDLEVPKGIVFGFLGPNGAGKTTTLRILTTLLPFEEGEAFVAGVSVKKHPDQVRKRIGYVSQKGGADSRATGWENLILQGRLYGMDHKSAVIQAQALVDSFSLGECISRLVEGYSGGQRRRLDIALAMMHQPEVLFLDEPTNGLDPQSRNYLWTQIKELKKKGITIFLTSHYLDEVDALSDSLAIMDHGKIVAVGTPVSLKKQISGDIVTLGLPEQLHAKATDLLQKNQVFREISSLGQELRLCVDKGAFAMPQILRLFDQAGIEFESMQMSLPSLNDVFLKKTGRSLREEINS